MKLLQLVTIGALVAGGLGAPAMAETLKVSSFLPPMHTFNKAIQAWGEELSEKTGGELQVEIFPAGQLGPPPRQFDLVRSGGADIAVILHGATPGRFPMTELAGLPLTHPSAGKESQVSSRRLTELAPEYLASEHEGTHILWMAVTPPLKLHFAKTDPSDLDAIKGLRIRYAGAIWQQVIEAMGASPVPVPPAESADAMGKGVVDGASFPYEATQAFDFAPVTKYSMEPGLASATFAVVMSDAAWDRLTPEMQQAITDTTGPDRGEWYGARWDKGESAGRQYMVDAGVSIIELNDEKIATLQGEFQSIISGAIEAVGGNAADFVAAYTK